MPASRRLRSVLPAIPLVLLFSCGSPSGGKSDAGLTFGTGDAGPSKADAGIDAGPTCSFDVHYGQGYPCNQAADCTTGFCYIEIDPVTIQPDPGFCTITCDPTASSPCPTGYACQPNTNGAGNVCALPTGVTQLPRTVSLPAGSPCDYDSDCAGANASCGFVTNLDGTPYTFCGNSCDAAQAGVCGVCGACLTPQGGGSMQCQPQGTSAIGAACTTRGDCATFDCRGFCTQQCAGAVFTPCPGSTICEPVIDDGQSIGLCVSANQPGATATGGSCSFDFQCVSGDQCHLAAGATTGTCQPGGGPGLPCSQDTDCSAPLVCRAVAPGLRVNGASPDPDTTVCTELCPSGSGCGTGNTCVVLDLDTDLQLYAAGAPDAGTAFVLLGDNNDINTTFGDRWSSMTQALTAGTYWIEVNAFGQSFGNYVLEISDGVNPESASSQTSSTNTSLPDAQQLTVPTKLSAQFSGPGDTQYYTFTLASAATLTLTTEPGAASACLPTASLHQVAVGSQCTIDYQCASSLCEQALQVCGKTCTENSDCGGVNPTPEMDAGPRLPDAGYQMQPDAGPPEPICANFGDHLSCVLAGQYDTLPAGATCDYSFQCTNGYCAQYEGAVFCTQACTGPDTCGEDDGMAVNQCAQITVSAPSGLPVSDLACVPLQPHGAACQLDADCLSDSCVMGACN